MTPTRFNFIWRRRAKTRTRLQGRLYVIQTGAQVHSGSQSIVIERTISIDMRKAFPLALFSLALLYAASAAALQSWLNDRLTEPASFRYCLLAPVHYSEIDARLQAAREAKQPKAVAPSPQPRGQTDALADSVQTSSRNRLKLVDNETAFFKAIDAQLKDGHDTEVLSDLSLARRRAPAWFPARQTELAQLEITLNARQGDLLALRSAASSYLNGTPERAEIMTASAQRLLDEKSPDAARALAEEILRKNADHVPARELLMKLKLPASKAP